MPDAKHKPQTGIVHLGLGAFFRAFGCIYVADAMATSGGDWGITGVSLRSADVRDRLKPRGWTYTAVTLAQGAAQLRQVEVLNDVLVAPENPNAVLQAMADPTVRIVTLTITEKGYCHDPATGKVNFDHPDIVHDLARPLPRSAPGFILRALQMRYAAGDAPFTVLSCDNLPENGALVRGVVLAVARRIDPVLANWIAAQGRFPATMVDRITPATTSADIERVSAAIGTPDLAPVLHEPFSQWVIEDNFVGGLRPDLEAADVQMVADVRAHEQMKLRMLNGAHSALAYLGYLAGHKTIAATVADPIFAAYVQRLWAEIMPAVTPPEGADLPTYADALLSRFANPAIQHQTWQIAMDGSQKLPQRLLQTMQQNIIAGREIGALSLAVAAWMRYASGVDEAGEMIDVRDPLADRFAAIASVAMTPEQTVDGFLTLTDVFSVAIAAQSKAPVAQAANRLWKVGARGAIQEFLE